MNKNKIIAGSTVAIVLIAGAAYLHSVNTKTVSEKSEYDIDWKDYIDIKFSGYNGASAVRVDYKELPEIQTKADTVLEELEKVRPELVDQKKEKELEDNFELESLIKNALYHKNYCELPDTTKLSNDDELVLNCENKALTALGYNTPKEYKVKVSGLSDAEFAEGNEEENSDSDNVTVDETTTKETYISEQGDIYYVDHGFEFITPINFDDFEYRRLADNENGSIIVVENEEDLEKAIEIARQNPDIIHVFYEMDVYDKDTNFEEKHDNYGFAFDR